MLLLNPPPDYSGLLGGDCPPFVICTLDDGPFDLVHAFTAVRNELDEMIPFLRTQIVTDGMIWISWPKQTSGVDTDLNGNIVRETGLSHGLVDVKICAVSDVWSGLKFVIPRKYR